MSPEMTQYYCALFHFARGLRGVNTLSGSEAACVANVLALCF
jgi:hypothetical protein